MIKTTLFATLLMLTACSRYSGATLGDQILCCDYNGLGPPIYEPWPIPDEDRLALSICHPDPAYYNKCFYACPPDAPAISQPCG